MKRAIPIVISCHIAMLRHVSLAARRVTASFVSLGAVCALGLRSASLDSIFCRRAIVSVAAAGSPWTGQNTRPRTPELSYGWATDRCLVMARVMSRIMASAMVGPACQSDRRLDHAGSRSTLDQRRAGRRIHSCDARSESCPSCLLRLHCRRAPTETIPCSTIALRVWCPFS